MASKTNKVQGKTAAVQSRAQGRAELVRAVRALRQAAIIATSAANQLERVVQLQNPDRFLRRWTAEQALEFAKKGTGK